MGGFLLVRKNEGPGEESEKKYLKSLDSFNKRGMKLSIKIKRKCFDLYLFDKLSSSTDNIFIDGNENFVASCGTIIYKQKLGKDALREIYYDFKINNQFYVQLLGNYILIIHTDGETFLLNDYSGLLRVYTNSYKSIFSSSFLSIYHATNDHDISSQELYEYIFHGSFHNNKTLFNSIRLIDSKTILKISSNNNIEELAKKDVLYQSNLTLKNFNHQLEFNASILQNYFLILKKVFGDNITSALSGGYDSRLMLAIMRNVGIKPKLYVYGKNTSSDVKVASDIAEGESFQLEVINKNSYPKLDINSYYDFIQKQFYMFDGLGNNGIFDNGSDLDTRIKRTKNNLLQLNGGGGEIYRNIWNLPNREFKISDFLKSYYDYADYSICSELFNKKIFFENFKIKVKEILNIDSDVINRKQVEMLYPFLRLKYFMSINSSINNSISFSITPYSEPTISYPTFNIPYKFKNNGLFQSSLIRYFDDKLASYNSNYGFNFSDPLNIKNKTKILFQVNTPVLIRPIIRKFPMHSNIALPYYLQNEYLKEIFNFGKLFISDFVDISKIHDSDTLSRALTLELLISKVFG